MIPSSNTVMETDVGQALNGTASVHSARMYLPDPITVSGEVELLDLHADHAARDLSTLEPDVVVFGCTSAGALRGAQGDVALRRRLSHLVGAPVVGVIDSLRGGLTRVNAHRIGLLTPYEPELTRLVEKSLRAEGFDVVIAYGLGRRLNLEIGRIDPVEIVGAAYSAFAAAELDSIAISCTNFRAVEAREEIESRLGVPVVTANGAVIERLRLLDDSVLSVESALGD
jgi:maleate isomerase